MRSYTRKCTGKKLLALDRTAAGGYHTPHDDGFLVETITADIITSVYPLFFTRQRRAPRRKLNDNVELRTKINDRAVIFDSALHTGLNGRQWY